MTAAQIRSELRMGSTDELSISGSSSTNKVNWLAERNGASVILPTHLYSKAGVKLVDTAVNTASAGSYTFSGLNFGPAYSGRRLIACTYVWATGEVVLDVSSVTIGGITAGGSDYGEFAAGGPTAGAGIFAASVPSGTSGTVVVQFPNTASGGAVALLSVVGISATEDIAGYTGTGSGIASDTLTLTAASNGVIIAAVCRTNTSGLTWTNGTTSLTELVDQTVDTSFRIGCAYANRLSSGSKNVGFSSTGTVATGFTARSYD